MALKKCKECGKEVSTKAKSCPNCGVKDPTVTGLDKAIGCLGMLIIIVGAFFWLFSGNGDNSSQAEADGFSTLSLNVRQGPSTDYDVVTSLKKGEQVRFLKDSLGWKLLELVERDEKPRGWASSKYLLDISEYKSFQKTQSKAKVEQRQQQPPTREEKIKNQFSAWDGSHRNLKEYIKKSMHDPKSFEHVETRYSDNGDYLLVVTTFRGNNAFGGKVKSNVSAMVSIEEGKILEILSQ